MTITITRSSTSNTTSTSTRYLQLLHLQVQIQLHLQEDRSVLIKKWHNICKGKILQTSSIVLVLPITELGRSTAHMVRRRDHSILCSTRPLLIRLSIGMLARAGTGTVVRMIPTVMRASVALEEIQHQHQLKQDQMLTLVVVVNT